MWLSTEFEALQKLFDTKFDSNLEDVLLDDEISAIKSGGMAFENLRNRIIVPMHNKKVYFFIMSAYHALNRLKQ